MLDFWGGVNVTLGLPIVRTSPDHGTAFDIAGSGLARPDSLIAAIRLAAEIAARRAAAPRHGASDDLPPLREGLAGRGPDGQASASASTSCSTSTSPARSPAWPARSRARP